MSKPKLRVYKDYKTNYKAENYCKLFLPKYQRSLICQLRLGILPLHLETGRYSGKPENKRLCNICNSGEIENENHFLFKCEFYRNERELFLNSLNIQQGMLDTLLNDNISNKLKFLLNEKLFKFSKYLEVIYNKRRRHLYK